MLLRETHAALAQRSDRTNNNQTLCTKLASAIVIAEENESKQKGRRSHGNKRSSFITSLTDFDDELTNFFLYIKLNNTKYVRMQVRGPWE
jgi:hypothetical protein